MLFYLYPIMDLNLRLKIILRMDIQIYSLRLIIPIKNKYALGIELHPYSYQKIDMIDTLSDDLIAFEDTLRLQNNLFKLVELWLLTYLHLHLFFSIAWL